MTEASRPFLMRAEMTTNIKSDRRSALQGWAKATAVRSLIQTVRRHRDNIMRKLNLKRLADLIRYALSRGITPDPP
jgi:Bacterial regulatory proteins, luxR family